LTTISLWVKCSHEHSVIFLPDSRFSALLCCLSKERSGSRTDRGRATHRETATRRIGKTWPAKIRPRGVGNLEGTLRKAQEVSRLLGKSQIFRTLSRRPIVRPESQSLMTCRLVPIFSAICFLVMPSRCRMRSTCATRRANLFRSVSRLPGLRQRRECRLAINHNQRKEPVVAASPSLIARKFIFGLAILAESF